MCVLFVLYTLLKVVSHYDLSVRSMSVIGFQKQIGFVSSIQFYYYFWNLFNFAKPLYCLCIITPIYSIFSSYFLQIVPGSSSSSCYHFYVGSMFDDIRLHVARSYPPLYSSFSMISSLTLSNHLLLGLPLFLLPCTSIYNALLPT